MNNEQLIQRVERLEAEIKSLKNQATIPYEVEQAFRGRLTDLVGNFPVNLTTAPLTAVTSPTGGATSDTQARSAIDTIITRLEDLGLILPN